MFSLSENTQNSNQDSHKYNKLHETKNIYRERKREVDECTEIDTKVKTTFYV